jgi:hypothetical protein
MSDSLPGIGDPYWYEWTVGLLYVLDLFNPDKHVTSVTLQASNVKALDDVVIKRSGHKHIYLQVKHTRAEDTLTFGDLVSVNEKKGYSLLAHLASGWKEETNKHGECEVILYTNRTLSSRKSSVGPAGSKYSRPSLQLFLEHLQSELTKVDKLSDVSIPTDWTTAWSEWVDQLCSKLDDEEAFQFLIDFKIEASQPGLDELDRSLSLKICESFQITETQAQTLHSRLLGRRLILNPECGNMLFPRRRSRCWN